MFSTSTFRFFLLISNFFRFKFFFFRKVRIVSFVFISFVAPFSTTQAFGFVLACGPLIDVGVANSFSQFIAGENFFLKFLIIRPIQVFFIAGKIALFLINLFFFHDPAARRVPGTPLVRC